MGRAQYTEVRCKTALNRVQGMPFNWSLNPYRGCRHACTYCLAPDTPVLYADMSWRPIGGVHVGDELAGFDEHPTVTGYRYFRPARVEAVRWSKRATRRIVTERSEVIATDSHRWLRHGRAWWVSTQNLGAGRALRFLPVDEPDRTEDDDYRVGYIAGLTLGDGTFRYEPGQRSDKLGYRQAYWRVAMADFEPLERLVAYLALFGIFAAVRPFNAGQTAKREMRKVEIRALDGLAVLHSIVTAERPTKSYYRGFLAGFFDAEGSNDGQNLRLHQRDHRVLDRVAAYAARLGLSFEVECHRGHVPCARLTGSIWDRIRFYALCRPAIARKIPPLWNSALRLAPAVIEAVERGPQTDVVDIQTSAHTFFAAGLATHNCYARVTHGYMDLDAGRDFDELIFVKTNVAEALRLDLRRPSWKRETVALGTASDPYQPAEGQYRLTRACLQVLADGRTPANVTTKGTLVVRDVDALQQLRDRAGARVSFSLITLDERVWRALEPGTPGPRQRLRAMERLAAAGVPCGLALAPVLPGLTDAPAALEEVVRAAADHGAQWLWSGTLHLEPAVRDWFLESLYRHFPESVASYERVFGASGTRGGVRYAPKAYGERLQRRVADLKAQYGLAERRRPAPRLADPAEGENIPGYPLPPAKAASRQLALPRF